MTRQRLITAAALLVFAIALVSILTSCALFDSAKINLEKDIKGLPMTMTTYDQKCGKVDEVSAKGFSFKRAEEFDKTTGADSKALGDVIELSVGKGVVYHVGSTLILKEDGLEDLTGQLPAEVRFQNQDPAQFGRPWLNYLKEDFAQIFKGKPRILMIRSQDGTPCAIFAGDQVSVYSTDVPKSTEFIVDKKLLVVYRADYTVYDTELVE